MILLLLLRLLLRLLLLRGLPLVIGVGAIEVLGLWGCCVARWRCSARERR